MKNALARRVRSGPPNAERLATGFWAAPRSRFGVRRWCAVLAVVALAACTGTGEDAFLRQEVERAGFRLLASGDFLRNPADPRDRNTPEPPMPKDEFVLKFVKP